MKEHFLFRTTPRKWCDAIFTRDALFVPSAKRRYANKTFNLPAKAAIVKDFEAAEAKIKTLKEAAGNYENAHPTDCESVKEYLQSIKSFISGQSGKGEVIISTYTAGNIYTNPLYQKLATSYVTSDTYVRANEADLAVVQARMQAEIEKAIQKQKEQAVWNIVNIFKTEVEVKKSNHIPSPTCERSVSKGRRLGLERSDNPCVGDK